MATFNLIRLTTFSVGTTAGAVFTVTCTIVFRGALLNSNYYTISHYAPEFEESKSDWLSSYGQSEPSDVQTYVMLSGSGALYWLLNLRVFARFIAAIELLRVGVRAVSLSLRLIANLSCGHILLTLYSSNLVSGFDAQAIDMRGVSQMTSALVGSDSSSLFQTLLLRTFVVGVLLATVGLDRVGVERELVATILTIVFFVCYRLPAILLVCRLLLGVLETVVAIVQAYVFLTLATSYLQ